MTSSACIYEFGLELRNCKLRIKILRNSSRKTKWEAIVLGFESKQPLQQQSTPACFTGHKCSMVVLWNVCFLSLQSSLCFSAWLWTTTLEIYVRFFWTFACGYRFSQAIRLQQFWKFSAHETSFNKHVRRHYHVARNSNWLD